MMSSRSEQRSKKKVKTTELMRGRKNKQLNKLLKKRKKKRYDENAKERKELNQRKIVGKNELFGPSSNPRRVGVSVWTNIRYINA